MNVQLDQLRTLRAISDTGSFELAARELSVSPSAVSQRVQALESAAGRIVLIRSKPIELTDSGRRLLRLARHIELLYREALDELQPSEQKPHIPVVANSDSLATWALSPLVEAAQYAQIEIFREDQSRSLDLLHSGDAMAAITSVVEPVPGCHTNFLGNMRYFACASAEFLDQWFPNGVTTETLVKAPMVVYDRKDNLQDEYLWLSGLRADSAPRSYVPATSEFMRAIELGLGWGTVPDLQSDDALATGRLVHIDPGQYLDVPLYWQQWKLRSTALGQVANAIAAAAAEYLH